MGVCSSGANGSITDREVRLSQPGAQQYGSGWSTVALHLAERHRTTQISIAESVCKRCRLNRVESYLTRPQPQRVALEDIGRDAHI